MKKTYYINNDGSETEITYYFKNDGAFKQSTVSKVLYENLNVANEKETRKTLATTNEMYDGSKGISHSIEYNDDYVVEKISVNYNEIDKEDLKELAILVGNSANAGKLSSDKIEKKYGELRI